MVLAEDLKDKKSKREMQTRERERELASCTGRVARAIACRSNALNLSIKTAVISTTTASNNLMINY